MRWKGSCNLPWIIWVRVRSWFRDSFGWGVGFEEKRLPSHMEIILVLHGIHGEFHLPLPNPTPGSDDIAYHIDIYLLFWGHISNSSTGKVQGNETLISHNYMYVRYQVIVLDPALSLWNRFLRLFTGLHYDKIEDSKQCM